MGQKMSGPSQKGWLFSKRPGRPFSIGGGSWPYQRGDMGKWDAGMMGINHWGWSWLMSIFVVVLFLGGAAQPPKVWVDKLILVVLPKFHLWTKISLMGFWKISCFGGKQPKFHLRYLYQFHLLGKQLILLVFDVCRAWTRSGNSASSITRRVQKNSTRRRGQCEIARWQPRHGLNPNSPLCAKKAGIVHYKWSRIGMSENGVYPHKKKNNGDWMGIMMIHQ